LRITQRILEACASYSWPGNVRELENFVKRCLVMRDENQAIGQFAYEMNQVGKETFGDSPRNVDIAAIADCRDLKALLRDQKRETEQAAIHRALEQTNGSKQEAATLLNISLRALHYKIRRYGIEWPPAQSQTNGHVDSGKGSLNPET
jgi:two-component system response regulator AtoC